MASKGGERHAALQAPLRWRAIARAAGAARRRCERKGKCDPPDSIHFPSQIEIPWAHGGAHQSAIVRRTNRVVPVQSQALIEVKQRHAGVEHL